MVHILKLAFRTNCGIKLIQIDRTNTTLPFRQGQNLKCACINDYFQQANWLFNNTGTDSQHQTLNESEAHNTNRAFGHSLGEIELKYDEHGV